MISMTETNDGFRLAEKDLELRGPGDFFGRKQSGMPEFKMADLVHDYRALETARQDAEKYIASEEFWSSNETSLLRSYLERSGALEDGIIKKNARLRRFSSVRRSVTGHQVPL
jgi:ATP-dependent DNA helicase RecG